MTEMAILQKRNETLERDNERLRHQLQEAYEETARARKTLHDWFAGQCLAGSSAHLDSAQGIAERALRIADHVMRLRQPANGPAPQPQRK